MNYIFTKKISKAHTTPEMSHNIICGEFVFNVGFILYFSILNQGYFQLYFWQVIVHSPE